MKVGGGEDDKRIVIIKLEMSAKQRDLNATKMFQLMFKFGLYSIRDEDDLSGR